jgi:hypothetical protein
MHPPKMSCSIVQCIVSFSLLANLAAGKERFARGVIDANPGLLHICIFWVLWLPNVTPSTNIRVAPFATDSWAPSNLETVSHLGENCAIASFPFRTTGIAKLSFAAASSISFSDVPLRNSNNLRNENSRHMVTPGSTLNDSVAFKASLPSFLRCCFN